MKNSLQNRLHAQLKDFDLHSALQLSDDLHHLEAKGEEFTPTVHLLWNRLTSKIELFREKQRK